MDRLIRFLKLKYGIYQCDIELTDVEKFIIKIMLSSKKQKMYDSMISYYETSHLNYLDERFAECQIRDNTIAIWFNTIFTDRISADFNLKIWEIQFTLYNLFINKMGFPNILVIYCFDDNKGWV